MREQERLPGVSHQEIFSQDTPDEVCVFSPAPEPLEAGIFTGTAGSPPGNMPGKQRRLCPEEEQEGRPVQQQQ